MTYTARFTHKDGSVDLLELYQTSCDVGALQRARSALYVSLSAVSVEVFLGHTRVGDVRRELQRFPRPTEGWRFAQGMAHA